MSKDMDEIISRGVAHVVGNRCQHCVLDGVLVFFNQSTAGISRDLRGDLFGKIIDWFKEIRGKFSDSTLITRTVNDVKQVSILVDLF